MDGGAAQSQTTVCERVGGLSRFLNHKQMNIPNGDRGKIIANLLELKHAPSFTDAERETNRAINLCAMQLKTGHNLSKESKTLLCLHKDVVITDKSQYRIESPSSLAHHVYVRNNPRADFYQEHKAVEYILFLKGIL